MSPKTYIRYYRMIRAVAICLPVMLSIALNQQPAFSQPAVNQATKEVDRSVRERVEREMMKAPSRPARIKETPEKKELAGPKLFVKAIKLEGVETLTVEAFKPILEKYENREVYESELKEMLKGEIEREYLRKGVLAVAFIPPQKIEGGVVILRVIEARMGDLEVTKARYFLKDRIYYYWAIKKGDILRYERISRSLQFMNKNPDREVKATILPGKETGTTDIALTQKTFFPFHVTASLDNEGSIPTGKMRKGLGFVENNLLGLDDTLMAGYTGGKSFGGAYAYHKVPITSFGTSIMYGYSRTKAFPKKDFEQYGISSTSDSLSAFLYQDIFEKDEYKGEISVGLEANDKGVVYNNGTINADRLRIMRIGYSFLERSDKSVAYIKPVFSQGLNLLGARRKSEFSSRQAENTFSKFNLSAQFLHRTAKNMQFQAKFTGQLASEKLMPQEELYIGGIDSVRGYPSGDYLADTGFYSNLELLLSPFFLPDELRMPYGERPVKDDITGVFFFDYGYGQKRGMIEGEQADRRMASIGMGVRIRLLSQATLRLEWGIPLDPMVNRPLTEGGGNRPRLHFSIDFQDNLDKELKRLDGEIKKKKKASPIELEARRKTQQLAAQK